MRDQRRILNRANAVANALGADFERFPYALGTRHFPGMAGEAQTAIARLAVEIGKQSRRATFFVAAQTDGYYAFSHTLCCKIEHWFCGRYGVGRCHR